METIGYAAHSDEAHMVPYHFERRALRPNDVSIEILYCGVCCIVASATQTCTP